MTAINFQPIFDYIDQSINPLKEEIAEIRVDINVLKTAVVTIITDMKNYENDMIAGNYRVKQLEIWAKPVGDKVDIPFAQ